MSIRPGWALIAVTIFLFSSTSVRAEIFKYTDEAGSTHYVDNPGKIPPKYRPKAENSSPQESIPGPSASPTADYHAIVRVTGYGDVHEYRVFYHEKKARFEFMKNETDANRYQRVLKPHVSIVRPDRDQIWSIRPDLRQYKINQLNETKAILPAMFSGLMSGLDVTIQNVRLQDASQTAQSRTRSGYRYRERNQRAERNVKDLRLFRVTAKSPGNFAFRGYMVYLPLNIPVYSEGLIEIDSFNHNVSSEVVGIELASQDADLFELPLNFEEVSEFGPPPPPPTEASGKHQQPNQAPAPKNRISL